MSGYITAKDRGILCTKSGNRCALPDCRSVLVEDAKKTDKAALIAEAAHIKGEKPDSPRYDAEMSDPERNFYENLVLLCPSCHTKIDKQPAVYPVELLHRYKAEHEAWVIEATKTEVINISFSELDLVTKHLIAVSSSAIDTLTLITPAAKISKNGLSASITQMILIGMTQVRQVASYIEHIGAIDLDFSKRLVDGFVAEYTRLRNDEGESGDNLFERLLEFSCAGSSDFKKRAAGLAVLVYLFEKCDIFEK